jgi:hypothetical protein
MSLESEHHQTDFFSLLPGSAGGRALRDRRGKEHFSNLARSAAAQRTDEERSEISRKAAKERRRRLYSEPRTVYREGAGLRVIERIVPWFPNQSRRKRPVFVRISLACEEIDEP